MHFRKNAATLDEKRKKRRRRKMEEFTIDEISAVDRPAQTHALARITKSRDTDNLQEDEMREYQKTADDFNEKVEGIAQRDRVPRHIAMSRVRKTYPRLYRDFQNARPATTDDVAVAKAAGRRRQQEVDLAIAGMRERNPRLSRTAALQQLRRSEPGLFA